MGVCRVNSPVTIRQTFGIPLCASIFSLCDSAYSAPDFARDVRPILERSCFGCHGPDKQKSGYRLDVRDVALKGGESGDAAIIPHSAAKSPLIRYVSGEDEEKLMPPKKSDKPRLTSDEVETLKAWVDAGPAWPDEFAGARDLTPHWSLTPLVKPAVPGGAAHPIDAFILAKLGEKKLAQSPEADRRTLMRRVTYDLTGLPPVPDDNTPFSEAMDRLLASPRYGERWARHWLDTIHFADTHGFEHDDMRPNAWRYRDYVVESMNRDTPWARFVREQIAADVFFPAETRLTAALGYLGAGTYDSSAAGTAPMSFEYLDRDDLVTQTMAAFVSTTANCARCHAHKFDPVTQEDYFALQAVFAGVGKGDVNYDEDPAVATRRRHWQSLKDAATKQDATILLTAENAAIVDAWETARGSAESWMPVVAETFMSADGSTLQRLADGSILASGAAPDKDTLTITATTKLSELTALRLDLLTDDSLPLKGPGRAPNGNVHLTECELQVFPPGPAKPEKVPFRRATSDFDQTGYDVAKSIDGDLKSSWAIHPNEGAPHLAVYELRTPLKLVEGAKLVVTLRQLQGGSHLIGRLKLSATSAASVSLLAVPVNVENALRAPAASRTREQKISVAVFVLRVKAEDELAKLPPMIQVWAAGRTAKNERGVITVAEPRAIRVLKRGDLDKPGDEVRPGALTAISELKARFDLPDKNDEASRRAALADWIVDDRNPLTWRSIVNRVWHYHFGRGLCDTPGDFGKMGGTPSHPELLDWLAVWFRDDAKGSLKALHKLIVTSGTYRQSSAPNAEASAIDPDNRLLWRMNRSRLDADSIRDSVLAISGHLDLAMGGPGIPHFTSKPGPQTTPTLNYENFDWNTPGAARRSIYRVVWRGIADPFMDAIDFPDLALLSPVRSFSASPLQSLALFNNEFVLHHCERFAARLEASGGMEQRIAAAFRLVYQRDATAEEVADFTALANKHGLPAALRVLFNSNEFLFLN